ncbi:MAG: M23 family metallopeptidase [Spirochaetaceae bacterium]|nr:M23 family metallopeptidase [Spirochaetaceae bacterium]
MLLVLFNTVLSGGCQTRTTNGAEPPSSPDTKAPDTRPPVWNGVPGEFKSAMLGVLRPGEPFVVAAAGAAQGTVAGSVKMQAVLIKGDKQLSKAVFFNLGEVSRRGPVIAAVMAVPVSAGAGRGILRIEAGGRLLNSIEVTIEERKYVTETFSITTEMSDILTKPDPEKTRQAEQLWAVWARTGDTIYTQGDFVMPVNSTVQTSVFGIKRVYRYPNGKTSNSVHTGVDWRAPTGTPIFAPAPGRVALAMNRITTGNTVVIEHMPGVYSICQHLDKIAVKEGDIVQAGTRIGDAGATGFATGAHLHWEVRVATEYADPMVFLGRKVLDKEAILAILNE